MEMKEKYLEWSYKAGGYKKARKAFTRYKRMPAIQYKLCSTKSTEQLVII